MPDPVAAMLSELYSHVEDLVFTSLPELIAKHRALALHCSEQEERIAKLERDRHAWEMSSTDNFVRFQEETARAEKAEARCVEVEAVLIAHLRKHNGAPGDPEPLCSCDTCVSGRATLTPAVETEPCGACGGSGEVSVFDCIAPVIRNCESCGGTGRAPAVVETEPES